jgi:23S rRNA (uracil1939-C5)-methyltransferase
MQNLFRPGDILQKIEITDLGENGLTIGRYEGFVVLVKGALPGDIADVLIKRKKKNYAEGIAVNFHTLSPFREKPFCSHFGTCGGCKWQNFNYEQQLAYKEKVVRDSIERIAKVEITNNVWNKIIPSVETKLYRNRLDFSFSNKRWLMEEDMKRTDIIELNALGFHIPGRFDKILDIEECYLQPFPSNEIRNEIRDYALKNKLSFFDLREQTGFLRSLIIRTSQSGEIMVIIAFAKEEQEIREKLLAHLLSQFPSITALYYVINSKRNDTIADQNLILYKGKEYITELMPSAMDSSRFLKFKVGPKSFYQPNAKSAYNLYKTIFDFADLSGNETVYDLYTGTGTIANFVAERSAKVIGVEYVEEAISYAKENAAVNNISNTAFFSGDMKDVLSNEFVDLHGKPHVIITDPPRAGMHENVVNKIAEISPQKIVYVSCNPSTQARDIHLLSDKYSVEKIQPVDMFPHTQHVENVVLMKKM